MCLEEWGVARLEEWGAGKETFFKGVLSRTI
jgi:hypothetical protein